MNTLTDTNIIFFGTSPFSVYVLDTLKERGIVPTYIVTTPDKPQGRKLILTSPPAKIWAIENGVPVLQFEKLNDDAVVEIKKATEKDNVPLFVVASYGKIIPQKVLDIPAKGALNIHPSLLPKYRGASPLQSTILADEKNTGVTIIQMDKLMDHGPIVAVKEVTIDPWPASFSTMERDLAIVGANLLADSIPQYIDGSIVPKIQDEQATTFTNKITKEDGKLDLVLNPDGSLNLPGDEQYKAFLKIQAFEGWPGTYFFTNRKGVSTRVSIKEADFVGGHDSKIDGKLLLKRVVPESGKEMKYEDFIKNL